MQNNLRMFFEWQERVWKANERPRHTIAPTKKNENILIIGELASDFCVA